MLILCNFLALIYTCWFQSSYTSPTFEVFLMNINSGVIRPLLYFVSILFNASLGRYIGRSRFFISVFKEYHIIAGDFVEVDEAEKMLHTLTVKLPLIITMFLRIIPFIIFSCLSDKMFFGHLADKKKLSLNITAFMFLDGLFLFYATYIIGVWLWLCFITKKMNQKVVENIDGDQLKLKNSLVCFMASIEKMKDISGEFHTGSADGGASGSSGAVSVCSGAAQAGPSGSVSMGSGASSAGQAGSVSVGVGASGSGAGGSVSVPN